MISKRPRCIIRYNDGVKFWWDVFVIGLAIYNCLMIPLAIAFDSPYTEFILYIIFDFMIDFFFLIDIFVNFSTTYYNEEGDEIFDKI